MTTTHQQASWKPLITIVCSMVMMYVTSFGINVLIGAIVKDLNTTVANVQFVIVAASLIAGSLMVTAGKLGDKFGKKKIFVIGTAIYTIGITTVVLSPSIAIFTVAWGLIWPSGMVLLIPTSIALIVYFYEGDQRAAAFGIYGASLAAISAIAPVVIGFLANTVGWRVALSISPAAGVITFLLALSLPETDKDRSVRIDIPSVLLSVAGFGLFLITTTAAGTYGWFLEKRPFEIGGSPVPLLGFSIVPVAYAISFALLALFIWRGVQLKRKGGSPLLGVDILKNKTFSLGMLIGASLFLVTAGTLFGLSVFLQAGVRFNSLQTALTLLPFSAAYAVASFATPNLGKKIAPKWIMAVGSVITIVFLWLIGRVCSMDMKPTDILFHMIALGVGMGLIMAQVTTVTMARVPAESSGEASGLSETLKEILGQGFAVALAGSVLFGAVYASMADSFDRIEGLDQTPAEQQEVVVELENIFQQIGEADEKEWVAKLPPKTRDAYAEIVATAATDGLKKTFFVMIVCMAIGLLLSLALPAHKMGEESARPIGYTMPAAETRDDRQPAGTNWRLKIGTWMFAVPFVMFVGAPLVVPFLGLSGSETAAVIGGVVVLAEVIWFASIPLLGKEGFLAMKKKAFGFLKLKTGPISLRRHRFGVSLFLGGLGVQLGFHVVFVVAYAIMGAHPEKLIMGMTFDQQLILYFSVLIAAIVATVVGAGLLGAGFSGRLKKAFDWRGDNE